MIGWRRGRVSERYIGRLINETARRSAHAAINRAPDGHMIIIQPPTRSAEQNSRMWAMLSDISQQVLWHGQKLDPKDWKEMATAALKKQRVVPGIEGGFVVLGARTSRMSVQEMREVIDFLDYFGAERGVIWSVP